MNTIAGTYIVTVDKDGTANVVDTSGTRVSSAVGFQAFRIIQVLQPNSGVIERMLEKEFGPPIITAAEPKSGITAPLFGPEVDQVKRRNLAVLIRRCALTELQHIASDGYDEMPDLMGRSLSDIRHNFDFMMEQMIKDGLVSETERNYALRYLARKLDPVKPFSIGITENNTTGEAYKGMVEDLLSWYNSKYLVNGYVIKNLDQSELEEIITLRQYVLLCQTGLQQNREEVTITEQKLAEIFGAICHMLKPERTVKT